MGMPGAICTLVMADYGAEVIKVEPPGGDPFRFQPAWISWNRGKKGIVLDVRTAEGREEAIRLAGEAKAGRMLNLQGQPARDGPVYSAVYPGSWHASQSAMRGIIGALRVRDLCGRGQWVQTSIVQNLAPPHDFNAGDGGLVNMQLRRRDPEGFPGRPGGVRGLSSIGYIPVRTKDGTWLQHANLRAPHIQGHLQAIGLGHLLEDERFKKVPAIALENRELLRQGILKKQLEKTADEWMEIYLKDGNIAAEPYRNSIQAMDHPGVVSKVP